MIANIKVFLVHQVEFHERSKSNNNFSFIFFLWIERSRSTKYNSIRWSLEFPSKYTFFFIMSSLHLAAVLFLLFFCDNMSSLHRAKKNKNSEMDRWLIAWVVHNIGLLFLARNLHKWYNPVVLLEEEKVPQLFWPFRKKKNYNIWRHRPPEATETIGSVQMSASEINVSWGHLRNLKQHGLVVGSCSSPPAI